MKEPTTAWTKAYLPKEIRDKEKFLLWVKVKKRLLYCGKILNYLLLIGVGLLFVYPFAWMFSMSLRPLIEALSFDPNLWVSDPQWSNYIYAWNQAQLSHYVGNSVKYSILVIGLQYFTCLLYTSGRRFASGLRKTVWEKLPAGSKGVVFASVSYTHLVGLLAMIMRGNFQYYYCRYNLGGIEIMGVLSLISTIMTVVGSLLLDVYKRQV